jgi:predicted nucleic acid-binding protein
MVLVDTSVWIVFFREGSSPAARKLDMLLEEGEACICGLIEAELLPGLHRKDRARVRALMAGLPCLETATDIWTDVADIQERSLAQGLGPFSIPDLIVAAVALRHEVPLFSLDKHFLSITRVTGLKLWEESPT